MHNDIRISLAARTEGLLQERLGVYCQPRMDFVQTDRIKGFKEGPAHAPDANISGTSRRVLGTAMGHAQRPLEHVNRVKKVACIDGKLMKNEMAEWENTAEFWLVPAKALCCQRLVFFVRGFLDTLNVYTFNSGDSF
jgi:hypothetical protein